jgi:hypothetical protein
MGPLESTLSVTDRKHYFLMIFVLDEEPRSGGRHAAMGGGGEMAI